MKEKLAYIALDYEYELETSKTSSMMGIIELANLGDIGQQNKGKMMLMEPKITDILELSSTSYDKTIEAIVYRKRTSKTTRTRTPTKFCCILIDRHGTSIQANMGLLDADYFDQLLQLRKAYRFTGFSCEPTDTWDRTLPTDASLIFACRQKLIQEHPLLKCKDHGPQMAEVYSFILTSSRRPDFILDKVFPRPTLALPQPKPIEAPEPNTTSIDQQTLQQSPAVKEIKQTCEEHHNKEPKESDDSEQTVFAHSSKT
nr:hypothetical protein [Tanacetum cinerariifolium]